MEAGREIPTGGGDPLVEQVELEFAAIRDLAMLQAIANQARKRREAEHAKEVIEQRVEDKRGGDSAALERRFEGRVEEVGSAARDVRLTELNTKQIITRLQADPSLRPAENTVGGRIVRAIVDNIPAASVNAKSAPYLFSILQKALTPGEASNPLALLSIEELRYLREAHPSMGRKVIEVIRTSARGTATEEQISEFDQQINPTSEEGRRELDEDGNIIDASTLDGKRRAVARAYMLPARYFYSPDQVNIAYGLLSAENFVEFIKVVENELRTKQDEPELATLTGKPWEERLSKEIEKKVIYFFDELFVPLDNSKPTEFFHSLAQQDYQQGFGTLLSRIETVFATMPNFLQQSPDPEVARYRTMTFWSNNLIAYDEERRYEQKGGNKETIRAIERRIKKHGGRTAMGLSDFMRNLKVMLTNEKELREFTHDAKALFAQPVGEKGFYPQLRDFSGRLAMSDIDEFLELPDNDIFMTAHSLYAKYLEEEFAKYDWRHQTTMFNTGYGGFNNKMEADVLASLRQMYPDAQEWQLKRALSLGVGASLGIFMTEVEIAAYADAHLDTFGIDTYNDYYRNGGGALKPLNPFAHGAWRWQKEHTTMADLLFLPIRKKGTKKSAYWDHTELFKQLKNYKQSFFDRSHAPLDDGYTRLIDIMNFGQVGGPIKRATWRIIEAIDHMAVYQTRPDGAKSADLDFLETWKSIENVGFEVLLNFQRQIGPLFSKRDGPILEERRKLFKYLYQNYTRPGATDAEFEDYFRRLEHARWVEGDFLDKSRMVDKPFPAHKDEIYRYELDRAMAAILKRRIPTKFLRIERGRFMKGGKNTRLWDTIKREMGIEEAEKFDEVIRDLGVAEAVLRNKVSTEMEHYLHHSHGEIQAFNNFSTDYVLTEAKIEEFLSQTFSRDVQEGRMSESDRTGRITRAKQAFNLLQDKVNPEYMDDFAVKLLQRFQGGNANLKAMTDIAFSVAPEELDMRFLNWRNGGPGVLYRANKETSFMEEKLIKIMDEFPNLLLDVATNGKHDFGDIIKALHEFKDVMTDMHGHSYASETAGYMSAVAISFFKKDTLARNIFTKATRIGKVNSMAAELAGTWRGVWEWEVSDIHRFISALESRKIVPKYANDVTDKLDYEEVEVKRFGRTYKKKVIKRDNFYEYSGTRLRNEYGARGKHIAMEVANKYLPMVGGILIFAAVADGIQESLEDVREGKKK